MVSINDITAYYVSNDPKNFFVNFLGGLVCDHSFHMSPILYFWEMSGFEPIELPYQAEGQPGTNLATHLPD